MNDLIYIASEIFLLLSSALLLLVNCKKNFLILLATLVSLVIIYLQDFSHSELIFNDLVAISPFIQSLKITILAFIAIIVLMIGQVNSYTKELPILISFSALGMMALVSANDLLSVYVAIELQSLPMYIMACINRKSLQSSEAGVKYFILGALASGILLYGISMIYGFTGSTNFTDLTAVFSKDDLELGVLVGSILIISAFLFKIGAAPFHMWVPDVYEGSPTIITAFFSTTPKIALIGLLIRVFDIELINLKLQQIFILIAILSLIISSFGALRQTNIKRLLAYSSIGHVGYILIGIASAMELKQEGIINTMLYTLIYLLTTIGIFSIVLRISNHHIDNLRGFHRRNPILSLCLVLFLISLAGLPPTAGFFAKLHILSSAVDIGLWWLALFALLTSVVSTYYYLNIIKIIYFNVNNDTTGPLQGPLSTNIILSSLTLSAMLLNITYPLYSGVLSKLLFNILNMT